MTTPFKTEKISEHVTRIILPGNVFSYLAEGTERAILIDTGCGLYEMRPFVEELLQDKPYEVVLTHGHVDHAGGASEFDRVWLNERDYTISTKGTTKANRRRYLTGNLPEGFEFTDDELVTPPDSAAYLPLEYGQTFELGGETLEIICYGGHTPGSIAVLFKNDRILLTGDACCSWTLIFAPGASLTIREYRENLVAAYEKYNGCYDRMLYSHPHNVGGPEVVPQMIEVCDEVLAGTDDHIARDLHGLEAYLAKTPGDNIRADGKIANVHFAAASI